MIRNYKGQQKNINQTWGPLNMPVSLCKLYISACRSWSANVAKCWGLGVCGNITLDWNQWVAIYTMLCLGPWWNNTVTKDLNERARKAWPNTWPWSETFEDNSLEIPWAYSFLIRHLFYKTWFWRCFWLFLKYTLFMEYFKFCLKERKILSICTIASEIEIKVKRLIVLTVYVYVFYSQMKNSEQFYTFPGDTMHCKNPSL